MAKRGVFLTEKLEGKIKWIIMYFKKVNNSNFTFASIGIQISDSTRQSPYSFTVHGQIYHIKNIDGQHSSSGVDNLSEKMV